MKKAVHSLIFLMIAVLIFQLTACGSGNKEGAISSTEPSNSPSPSPDNTPAPVTLRVMDWSDSVKPLRDEFHKRFMEKYPHITIEYTMLTVDQFKNTILTAVKSNEAPDLFPVPVGMKLAEAVQSEWFQPLDPFIDDAFKNIFVEGTFKNGTTMVGDQIYAIPESMALPSSLIFYNKKLFKEAGLDPENPPTTYQGFREAAKKITEAGKYYGMIEGGKQINRWMITAQDWSSLGGSGLNSVSPLSLVTNKPTYDSKAVLDVFDLFKGLTKDGSMDPKTMSISAPEARALFGQGQAGFLVQGPWCIGVWNKDNPDLDYGVMAPPLPDGGQQGSIPLTSSTPWIGLSAGSKHPEAAALYLQEYYGGDFFQQQKVASGDSFSVVKGINEQNLKAEQLKQYYDISQKYGRLIPEPGIRNPETSKVFAEYKDVHPNLGELLSGVVAGAVNKEQEALGKLSKQVETAWSSAIDAAIKNGAKVAANDFVFPNWDSMKNYTSDDYKALTK
ncbi:MAG TPA: sugar ABC transporter substrate-binding protein [Bacilli bacterium]